MKRLSNGLQNSHRQSHLITDMRIPVNMQSGKGRCCANRLCRVFLKKVLYKSEEKMQEKMKMIMQTIEIWYIYDTETVGFSYGFSSRYGVL